MTSLQHRIIDWQKENSLQPFSGPLVLSSINNEDSEEIEQIFLNKAVSELDPNSLACKDYLLLRLTHSAFLYYLPRFLELTLTSFLVLDVFCSSLFSELNPPMSHNNPRNTWLKKYDEPLSLEKKQIIAEVLKECRDKWGDGACEQAIENFWNDYLE